MLENHRPPPSSRARAPEISISIGRLPPERTTLSSLVNGVNNRFGSYPLHIFGDLARFVLTFGVPVAFSAYLPATVLLGRTGALSIHPALA